MDPRNDLLLATIQEVLDDVDKYGALDGTIYGKYRIRVEKNQDWRKYPIYNMGYSNLDS